MKQSPPPNLAPMFSQLLLSNYLSSFLNITLPLLAVLTALLNSLSKVWFTLP